MAETFTNNASSTLAGTGLSAASPGASQTWQVLSVVGFPPSGTFRCVCAGEVLKVNSVNPGASPPTMTGLRGQEGTGATAKTAGTTITEVLTADALATLMTETLARVATAAPLTVTYPGGNPTIAIPPGSGSQDGYITMAQSTKLAAIQAGSQVNALELVTVAAPLTTGPVVGKQQPLGINPASAGAAGTQSAAHFNLLQGANVNAAGSTLSLRDSAGHGRYNYLFASYFNSNQDEYRSDQPARLIGGTGDGYYRTYHPGYVTVGGANGLSRSYADGQKLDNINMSLQPDSAGWWSAYFPDGVRHYWMNIPNQGLPASNTAVLCTLNPPAGLNFSDVSNLQATAVIGNAQSVVVGTRFLSGGATHGHLAAGAQLQVVARHKDDQNLNGLSTYASVYVTCNYATRGPQ